MPHVSDSVLPLRTTTPSITSSTPGTATSATPRRGSGPRPRTRDGLARPKRGEVRVRIGALGMSPLGLHASGLVQAVGPEAGGFAPGDRVAYLTAFSDIAVTSVVSERDLIGFPKDVAVESAAAYLPLGLIARAVVKQLHSIGRGNTVSVASDASGADAFVSAWARDLGAIVVDGDSEADVVVTPSDYLAATRWRYGHGLGQIAAADVFQEVRRGVFDDIPVTSYPMAEAARARSDYAKRLAGSPIVLVPAA